LRTNRKMLTLIYALCKLEYLENIFSANPYLIHLFCLVKTVISLQST
jgi:hypothetical protein